MTLLVTSGVPTRGTRLTFSVSSSIIPSTMAETTEAPKKESAMGEICEEAGKNGWYVFENELPHSRGYPKMMRGDYRHLGNAPSGFRPIADEFFGNLLP